MNENECLDSLRRCFGSSWMTKTNGNELVAYELNLDWPCINIRYSIRLGKSIDIAVNGRLLSQSHTLVKYAKGLSTNWNSIYHIVKHLKTDYIPCSGVNSEASAVFNNVDIRPFELEKEAVCHGSGDGSSSVFNRQCVVLIFKHARGLTSESCPICRSMEKQLLNSGKKAPKEPYPSPMRYAGYSKVQLQLALTEKQEKNQRLQTEKSNLQEKINKMEAKSKRAPSVRCQEILEEDLKSESPTIPTFTAMILQQQFKALNNHPHGMRWDGEMLGFAMALRQKSIPAYDFLNVSGALRLPTLKK